LQDKQLLLHAHLAIHALVELLQDAKMVSFAVKELQYQ